MQHTYLFEEGTWTAVGRYRDERGTAWSMLGRSEVRHRDERWILDGSMEVRTPAPLSFVNLHDVTPFEEDDHTTWSSTNPAIGRLEGTYCVVDDALLSSWTSVEGDFRGSEVLRLREDGSYRCHGALFDGARRVSSWTLELTRES